MQDRICAYKGCNTVLAFCNPNEHCFVHVRKILAEEAEKDNHKSLKKSNKFAQISNWTKDWRSLRHFKETLPNILLCQRKKKNGEGEAIPEYAVFSKTIRNGVKLKKRDLAKIRF